MLILKIYLYVVITVIIHELLHYLLLKLSKVKCNSITLGNVFYFKYKKLNISPLIFSGNIEFSKKDFLELPTIIKILIFVIGPMGNILVFYFFNRSLYIFSIINLIYGLYNIIPLPLIKTDGYWLVKILLNKI